MTLEVIGKWNSTLDQFVHITHIPGMARSGFLTKRGKIGVKRYYFNSYRNAVRTIKKYYRVKKFNNIIGYRAFPTFETI